MNVTEEAKQYAYEQILGGKMAVRTVRKHLGEMGYEYRQIDRIVADAKARIREECDELKNIQFDLNLYRLNEFVANKDVSNSDKLKAIDLINKLCGFYTVKLELTRQTRFVLGASDDESVEYANYETVNDGQVERLLEKGGGNDE